MPSASARFLAARDDTHDFQPVARVNNAVCEFAGGDSFAVVFHHDASGEQILRAQKILK